MTSNVKIYSPNSRDELTFKGSRILGSNIETKLDELKADIIQKIQKELTDSQNARDYITQKYAELCNKISFLTDLDATVTGFRADVKTIERQISELATRVDDIEMRSSHRESPVPSFMQQF